MMNLIELLATLRLGLANVRAHKLRSILTVLGIVFGVCSVISMLAIGEGASQEVQERLNRLGSRNIIIRSFKPPQRIEESSDQSGGLLLEYGLTYRDAERLLATLPNVEAVIPVKVSPIDLWVRHQKLTVQLVATVPWIAESQSIRLEDPSRMRFITQLDPDNRANVIVISDKVARSLFLYEDPIGKSLKVGADVYRVVGVTRSAGPTAGGASGVELASQSADAYVPITTLRAREGDLVIRRDQGAMSAEKVELSELILQLKPDADGGSESVVQTARIVESMMASMHPKGDYQLIVPLRLIEEARRTQQIFKIVLSSIAAISLLVGGIGIMNIMLASVSERTREIGVRRALGARRRDIQSQFIVETLILSVGGGLIGMGLGAVIPWLVQHFAKMPTRLTPESFILSFAVSAIVGLVFGVYPARRAAMMDPIEALRHE